MNCLLLRCLVTHASYRVVAWRVCAAMSVAVQYVVLYFVVLRVLCYEWYVGSNVKSENPMRCCAVLFRRRCRGVFCVVFCCVVLDSRCFIAKFCGCMMFEMVKRKERSGRVFSCSGA